MTAGELIDILKKHDPSTPVKYAEVVVSDNGTTAFSDTYEKDFFVTDLETRLLIEKN